MDSKLKANYPWIEFPLIVSAPMRPYAKHELVTEVVRAGGIGFLPNGNDTAGTRKELRLAIDKLNSKPCSQELKSALQHCLPLGIGYQIYQESEEEASDLVADFKPAAVWLFAARDKDDYVRWANIIRKANPTSSIWIQVGNVSDALEVVKLCGSNIVLVMQGIDAGGHGLAHGAGLVTLLPEAIDALKKYDVPVLAAGGISEGRSAAAALLLGADGVVVGTRLLAACEATTPRGFLQQILDTSDGGITTRRTRLFDNLRGTGDFPSEYDGRALTNQSIRDIDNGVSEHEAIQSYRTALKDPDTGFGMDGRLASYAGTGVGLIKSVKPAAEILKEIRLGALKTIELAHKRIGAWK